MEIQDNYPKYVVTMDKFSSGLYKSIEVCSAGTNPSSQVHPKAIEVMREFNIDISSWFPKKVDRFINSDFDYVITVCDHAKETCPSRNKPDRIITISSKIPKKY